MRTKCLLILLLANTYIFGEFAHKTEYLHEEEKINMQQQTTVEDDVERSIDISVIEAVFNSDTKQVEVTLHNIGDAEISIIDSQNHVVSRTTVNTDFPTTVFLNTYGTTGRCSVIVRSSKYYAIGVFIL